MNHYTYLLQSKTADLSYIGVRSCSGLVEEDVYWGSSKHLPDDVATTFNKSILGRFDTREEAVADEINRHNDNDVAKNPLFINKAKQTATGFDRGGVHISEEHKNKIRDSMLGVENHFYGKSHSEESIKRMSDSKLGNTYSAGHIHSAEQRNNISKGRKGISPTFPKVTCNHCGKVGGTNIMKRYHFDQCKFK
tara:strand:- start:21 stop:599 length:579 start_codon:yes stop_codon:yes gene_type:complete